MYLEVKNLVKYYGNNKVIDDLSFSMNKSEILCLLGESGCGKTTTLNIIGGFLFPDSGNVLLDNKDITHIDASERATSTVFQNYGLFPNMSVIDNVTYGLKIRHIDKKKRYEKGIEYLEIVGLNGLENKNVENISGGQRQRVALARALIVEPKLCLLDEPLSNLDYNLRLKMRKEIKRIQQALDITMIFVTHDIEEAFSIADNIIIMNKGKIVDSGKPLDIIKNTQNDFVKEFLNVSNYHITEDNKIYKVI